jgi:hypothetical protein
MFTAKQVQLREGRPRVAARALPRVRLMRVSRASSCRRIWSLMAAQSSTSIASAAATSVMLLWVRRHVVGRQVLQLSAHNFALLAAGKSQFTALGRTEMSSCCPYRYPSIERRSNCGAQGLIWDITYVLPDVPRKLKIVGVYHVHCGFDAARLSCTLPHTAVMSLGHCHRMLPQLLC